MTFARRVRAASAAMVWLGSTASCSGETKVIAFDADLPPSVDWVVAALVGDNSTAASPLMPRDQAVFRGEIRGDVEDGTLWALGFTEAEVRALSDLEPDRLSSTFLRVARTGEPRLPGASWRARAAYGTETVSLETPAPGEAEPPLTADWLPRCPELVTELTRVRVDGIDPCGATAAQEGCRLEIDLGSCGVGVSGTIVGGGETVLEGSGEYARCISKPAQPTYFTCTLRSGKNDEIELIEAAAPRFEVERLAVSSEQYEPDSTDGYPFRPGAAHGPALVGGRVAMSRTENYALGCELGRPKSELVFVDPASWSIVQTATAPDCLIFLESEPERQSFLGFSGLTGMPSAHRFDRDGRVMDEVFFVPTRPGQGWIDVAKVVGDRIVILLRFVFEGGPEPPSELIVLDRATLQEVYRIPELPQAPNQPFRTQDRIGLMSGSFLELRDPDDGTILDSWTTARSQNGCFPGLILSAQWVSTSQRVIATEQRDLNRVVVATRESCSTFAFHEWAAAPLDLWPTANPNRWLVSVNGNDRVSPGIHDNTGLGEVDLETMRFLPGVARFGRGPLRGLIEDEDGFIWASLPWMGELVRIRRLP